MSLGRDIQKRSFPQSNGSSSRKGGALNGGKASNLILAQGNDNVKTEMQIALEKAGVDSSIFENDEKDTRQMSIKDASAAGADNLPMPLTSSVVDKVTSGADFAHEI